MPRSKRKKASAAKAAEPEVPAPAPFQALQEHLQQVGQHDLTQVKLAEAPRRKGKGGRTKRRRGEAAVASFVVTVVELYRYLANNEFLYIGAFTEEPEQLPAPSASSSAAVDPVLKYGYDICVGDGKTQEVWVLDPALYARVYSGELVVGAQIQVKAATTRVDDTVVGGKTFTILTDFQVVQYPDLSLGPLVGASQLSQERLHPVIGKKDKGCYLNLYTDDSVQMAHSTSFLADTAEYRGPEYDTKLGSVRKSNTLLIGNLHKTLSKTERETVPVVGVILSMSNIFRFKDDQFQTFKYPCGFSMFVKDETEVVKVSVWNRTALDLHGYLRPGMLICLYNYQVKLIRNAEYDQYHDSSLRYMLDINNKSTVTLWNTTHPDTGFKTVKRRRLRELASKHIFEDYILDSYMPLSMAPLTLTLMSQSPISVPVSLLGLIVHVGPFLRGIDREKNTCYMYRWIVLGDVTCQKSLSIRVTATSNIERLSNAMPGMIVCLSQVHLKLQDAASASATQTTRHIEASFTAASTPATLLYTDEKQISEMFSFLKKKKGLKALQKANRSPKTFSEFCKLRSNFATFARAIPADLKTVDLASFSSVTADAIAIFEEKQFRIQGTVVGVEVKRQGLKVRTVRTVKKTPHKSRALAPVDLRSPVFTRSRRQQQQQQQQTSQTETKQKKAKKNKATTKRLTFDGSDVEEISSDWDFLTSDEDEELIPGAVPEIEDPELMCVLTISDLNREHTLQMNIYKDPVPHVDLGAKDSVFGLHKHVKANKLPRFLGSLARLLPAETKNQAGISQTTWDAMTKAVASGRMPVGKPPKKKKSKKKQRTKKCSPEQAIMAMLEGQTFVFDAVLHKESPTSCPLSATKMHLVHGQ